ncbi:hypothetical protein ASPZODRAFT_20044 [Penicilliopsis zonata CBS 506.65]|uniref:Uncharacterized protein n=1 Tax=Penicilliopsis zonata CBS 506.65 TaxID=1073090 RepID=A0A1L9S6K2_9EURO|nr:hypothetical protein ASPZODRAFT_20044 [Penicilliopsis zonata CBS 506.65]OJJ42765.1 hypothetical protein ASPZODRAFT_20044 [Penicilliopsis zonata CBS 506.65]
MEPAPLVPAIWAFNDEGQLVCLPSQDSQELTVDRVQPEKPSPAAIAAYLAHLTPLQQERCDQLRAQGWDDEGIHNFFSLLENCIKLLCARLREQGRTEEYIGQLAEQCGREITDFSHLRRPLETPGEEDLQLQLYLLAETRRQHQLMLGDERRVPSEASHS